MPFYLYEVTELDRHREYKQFRPVSLAGTSGPLKRIHDEQNQNRAIPDRWKATEDDLVVALGGNPGKHAIVIDLKPRQVGNVSLFRVRNIWGYSHVEWTPIALHLETLFADKQVENATAFKLHFSDADAEVYQVAEFLYLQGGVKGGKWTWGMVGRVNGALLWPDAFHYLTGELGKAIPRSE